MTAAMLGWRREGLVWVPPDHLTSVDEPDPEWAIRPPEVVEPVVDEQPKKKDNDRPKKPCGRCGRPVKQRSKVCADCRDVEAGIAADYMTQEDRLWETLARTMAVPLPAVPLGVTCACGCLLASAAELCPVCVIPWMRANDVVDVQMARDMDNEFYYQPQRNRRAA